MITRLTSLAVSLILGAAAAAAAPGPTTISIFKGSNGNSPFGEFLADKAGNLYGVTGGGGTNTEACPGRIKTTSPGKGDVLVRAGCGVVFKLAHTGAAWTETVLHDFALTDGARPGGALVADGAGNLYGTANVGGKTSARCPGNKKFGTFPGCGVVFKLTPPAGDRKLWSRTVLYEFSGTDGASPNGNLVFDSAGNLYGATMYGGTSTACPVTANNPNPAGCGVVFKLSPPSGAKKIWTEAVLHNFGTGNDGQFPRFGLVIGKTGNLFGTTSEGGGGTSACPADSANNIAAGCGVVFRLSQNSATGAWSETILDAFAGQPHHPAAPYGALLIDQAGNIYGTSYAGGAHPDSFIPTGQGTVYRLAPPAPGATRWTETVLHSFGGEKDGQHPLTGLVSDLVGDLYGTTEAGGYVPPPSFSLGTVFKLSPPVSGKTNWTEKVLANFDYFGTGGIEPATRPMFGPGGVLYSATANGQKGEPDTSYGTIFEVKY